MALAWSMSPLPGMPPGPPPPGRRAPRGLRSSVACWICGKAIISHGAKRPACRECHQKYGSGVCSKCGGPKRVDKPGLCRNCRQPAACSASAACNAKVHTPRICALCEESYVPKPLHRPDQQWCSKSCAQAWRNGARPPYDRHTLVGLPRKRRHDRIRRQRRAETWDGVTNAEIMERDRWRCGICGKAIGKKFKWPHPRSASIDHIVPISEGGADTAGNKRAAHLACNGGRCNRGGGEQAALF